MDHKHTFRTLGLLAGGLAALAFMACDSGTSETNAGGGGGTSATTGTTTPTTSTGTTNPSTTSSTGSGQTGNVDPIDNMASNTGSILTAGGRTGAWYTYNDGSGTQTPVTSDTMPFVKVAVTDASAGLTAGFAAQTFGSGFSVWGAGMGFDFNNVAGKKSAYDGAKYTGITFWAKAGSQGDATGQSIRFSIVDVNTAPEGGKCDPASTTKNQCNDAFGTGVTLTNAWQQYTFTWSQLAQEGWGMNTGVTALATNALYSVHFQVAKSAKFDVWVSYIGFTQ
ncbi:Hypothetical protein A7982_03335 [Minicystis rosea]|nr:Hypothetical protein A7982_03335 [Minicystis rosea]